MLPLQYRRVPYLSAEINSSPILLPPNQSHGSAQLPVWPERGQEVGLGLRSHPLAHSSNSTVPGLKCDTMTSPYFRGGGNRRLLLELVRVHPIPERVCPGDVFRSLGLASVTGSCRSSSKNADQPRATSSVITWMALRAALARDASSA